MKDLNLDPAELMGSMTKEDFEREEGYRNLTCAIMKKDPTHLMKVYSGVWKCLDPSKENVEKFQTAKRECMSRKARAEEEAFDKEQAAGKKKS